MITRTIEIDEQADKMLTELAAENGGDLGRTVAELLEARESLESIADASEAANEATLLSQRSRSERSFGDGTASTWESLKQRHHL